MSFSRTSLRLASRQLRKKQQSFVINIFVVFIEYKWGISKNFSVKKCYFARAVEISFHISASKNPPF